jgi:hypothetical protein
MKSFFLMAMILAMSVSCNSSNSGQTSTAASSKTAQATDTSTSVPIEASTFETRIVTRGLSVEQETDVQKAADIIKQVVASQEFKDRVLNHTVNGVKTYLNNNGLTNEEIYQKILDAADDQSLTKDNIMNLELEVAATSSGGGILFQIVSGIKKILSILNLFSNPTPAGIAQKLFQMWLGNLGFTIPTGTIGTGSVQAVIAGIIGELGKSFL